MTIGGRNTRQNGDGLCVDDTGAPAKKTTMAHKAPSGLQRDGTDEVKEEATEWRRWGREGYRCRERHGSVKAVNLLDQGESEHLRRKGCMEELCRGMGR